MSFVPVDFRLRDRTIRQLDPGDGFPFLPVTFTVRLPKLAKFPDAAAFRNGFNIRDGADDFHWRNVCLRSRTLVQQDRRMR